jgi:hypothetical protein
MKYWITDLVGVEREVSKTEFYLNKFIYYIAVYGLLLALIGMIVDIIRFSF